MTNLFLTTTSVSAATPGGAETTRWRLAGATGASGRVLNKNTVAGPTAPLGVTDSATAGTDGNSIAWYSDPLSGATIAGQITASLWGVESSSSANAAPCIGVYLCAADGTLISAIADPASVGSQGGLEFATTAGAKTCTISAASVTDTVVAAGQRLKVTLCIDDAADQGGSGSMTAVSRSVQYTINGNTGSAGQSQIAFTETLISTVQAGSVAIAGRPVNPGREAPVIISGF